MSENVRKLSPPRILGFVRILLHFFAAGLVIFMIWLAGGFDYAAEMRSEPESVKGPIAIGFLIVLLATIYGYDRLFLSILMRFYGQNPHDLHWSERLNRNGAPFCPDCHSIYLYRPDSGHDEDYVRCGDCGFAIATLGEMRPFFEERMELVRKRGFGVIFRG